MNYLANLERYICLNLKPGCFNALLSASLQRNSKNDNHEQEYYKINNYILEYIKHSNTAANSVDSDMFYTVIHLPAHSKTYVTLYFSK